MTVCVSVVADIMEAYFKNKGGNKSHWGAKLLLNQMKKEETWLVAAERFSQGVRGRTGERMARDRSPASLYSHLRPACLLEIVLIPLDSVFVFLN